MLEMAEDSEVASIEGKLEVICSVSNADIVVDPKSPLFLRFGSSFIYLEQMKLEFSYLVCHI